MAFPESRFERFMHNRFKGLRAEFEERGSQVRTLCISTAMFGYYGFPVSVVLSRRWKMD